jgi:hypothetical protein
MKFVDEEEEFILTTLRSNPGLKACFLEMLDITDGKSFEEIKTGDDAEEAVVGAIQKTGQALLQDWADKKTKKAEEDIAKDKSFRMHKKKGSNGKLP